MRTAFFLVITLFLTRVARAGDLAQPMQPVLATPNGPFTVNVSSQALRAVLVNITVSGGAGSGVFSSTGSVNQCSVVPAADTSTYVFEIVTNDAAQFNVFGSNQTIFGRASLHAFRYFLGSHLARITSATVDGLYQVRCVVAP